MVLDAGRMEPDLALARPGVGADVESAIEIGDLNRKTLGLLPRAAYADAAARGTLLLARLQNEVVGYALYGVTRRHVRLTHLCVRADFRERGIAKAMVNYIRAEHAGSPGIKVRCRRSYGIDEMWIGLGFAPLHEGHGKSEAPLTYYWLDNDHPSLMTQRSSEALFRAAVDLSVVSALAAGDLPENRDAVALTDDQVSDRLELVRTSALDKEITAAADAETRKRLLSTVSFMSRVNESFHQREEVRRAVLQEMTRTNTEYPATQQEEFGLNHVVDAIAAGLNVLVTSDTGLMKALGPVCQRLYGLRIMLPADVIVRLDELVRAETYRPAALLGTAYRTHVLSPTDVVALDQFEQNSGAEPAGQFQTLLRDLTQRHRRRTCILDPAGRQVSVYSDHIDQSVLRIPLLRVAPHALADSLARQLLFRLRSEARGHGVSSVVISDEHVGPTVAGAALEDGFQPDNGRFVALTIDVTGSADEVNAAAALAAQSAAVPPPATLRSTMPVEVIAEYERNWWPVKMIDSQLPTYVIPIQQGFSRDLLGVPDTIDPRPDLGLSRDLVYYRSSKGLHMKAPARLLWYMSRGGNSVHEQSAIVGCSQLEEIINGPAAELHRRFQHFGVWQEHQVVGQADKRGIAQALKFTNTEAFSRLVGVGELQRIGSAHGGWSHPQSPRALSSELFADIYRAGQANS
jgi:GNAT superfamily N-acetyltransferase